MNRHFVYSAMTDTVLGTPIRREESKSRETPWVPTDTPGYFRRINSEGRPEVSHVDNLPKPGPLLVTLDGDIRLFGTVTECAAQAPEAATLGAEPAVSTPDAAHQWQAGVPPERGWYEVLVEVIGGVRYAYYFGGTDDDAVWSLFGIRKLCCQADIDGGPVHPTSFIQWRGPRLIGPDWPEAL